jgi:hypothetical protein
MNLLQMFLASQKPECRSGYIRYSISGHTFPDWSILRGGHFAINIEPDGKVLTFCLYHPIGGWDMNESSISDRPVPWHFNVHDPDAYETFMRLIAEAAAETEEDVREHEAREAAIPRNWFQQIGDRIAWAQNA